MDKKWPKVLKSLSALMKFDEFGGTLTPLAGKALAIAATGNRGIEARGVLQHRGQSDRMSLLQELHGQGREALGDGCIIGVIRFKFTNKIGFVKNGHVCCRTENKRIPKKYVNNASNKREQVREHGGLAS
jgi:hypothetical protein